eukprot:Rmarinus@m.18772
MPHPHPPLDDGRTNGADPLIEQILEFMGRKKMKLLLTHAMTPPSDKVKKLLVYGTTGHGKSYMLAAVAAYLLSLYLKGQSKIPVVYIPDCTKLLVNGLKVFKHALLIAHFYDAPEQEIINGLSTFDELHTYSDSRRIVYIADQFNALVTAEGRRTPAYAFFDCQIHTIFGASANNECAKALFRKQTDMTFCYLTGGLDTEEADCWFQSHPFELGREEISIATGNIPLYLTQLYSIQSPSQCQEKVLLRRREWLSLETERITSDLLSHFNALRTETDLEFCMDAHINLLAEKNPLSDCFDHRYFYSTHKYTFRSELPLTSGVSCGMVRKALVGALRQMKRLTSMRMDLLKLISLERNNAVISYWVEQVVLSIFQADGIKVLNLPAPASSEASSMNVGSASQFVPSAYDFPYIDSLYAWHSAPDRWDIYVIQVTLSSPLKHTQTYQFFKNLDPRWKPKVAHINWNLVWVTGVNNVAACKNRSFRFSDVTLQEYFLSFRDVHAELADRLREPF